jgi:hypothetical protein
MSIGEASRTGSSYCTYNAPILMAHRCTLLYAISVGAGTLKKGKKSAKHNLKIKGALNSVCFTSVREHVLTQELFTHI